MLRDEVRLGRRLEAVRHLRTQQARDEALTQLAKEFDASTLRATRRRSAVPAIAYPDALPVSQAHDELIEAIRDHQVVVVAGETGSGKTTQIPKMCLELGRGTRALIGHTQPRRIAARTVAERIAQELGVELGSAVGYTVRFTDHVSDATLVKLMTDGILLAEIQRDRLLSAYDTLIIDEAHERSLNIDFILGYIAQLLPSRPDLKVIITSATIDPERFAAHFGGAPIVEVSGRTFPVEVRYRPIADPDADDEYDDEPAVAATPAVATTPAAKNPKNPKNPKNAKTTPDPEQDERDLMSAIADAVDELTAEGNGDILVFLSGEREIRDAADALKPLAQRQFRGFEVLPLYARLSAAEQHRVFEPHSHRRVVLATNVAETSLTVPGIRYVVDPGTARISRYSHRLKVQRLPIERISQASANQRAGRCGRVADGICIRLYSEEDFADRPEFTDPEILRTNLASVILAMTALGLGDIEAFPFVEPPDRRQVRDGVALLHELGAIMPDEPDPAKRLTEQGRMLAQLPIDPRFARMVVEADRRGCLREVLVITAALSIQDPRERPAEHRQAADDQHRRFAEPDSDFLSYLGLWTYLSEQQEALSGNAFRRLCKSEFLHYLRIREWQDLFGQLRQIVSGLGLTLNSSPADPREIHRALLAGLLSHIGQRDPDKRDYIGARNARFAIWPGSGQARKQPAWVMAAELVETSRLWAREVAKIDPEWAEQLAPHLIVRTYNEPHWDRERGTVVALERVTLYGVPIVSSRRVDYARIDPELSRELFIRHALVEGDWETKHTFFHANRALLADATELEERARRRDIVVGDDVLFDFYDRRVDADVVSARHFDAWWKRERETRPTLLDFSMDLLVNDERGISRRDFPDRWRQGELTFDLTYKFEPGQDADGVTVHIPLAALNQVSTAGFDWQIPGLRAELVAAHLRALPKSWRRSFVPAEDVARAAHERLAGAPSATPFTSALIRELERVTGISVPANAFDLTRIPPHLRVTFRVEDDKGRRVAEGKDLPELQRKLTAQLRDELRVGFTRVTAGLTRTGLRDWTFPALERVITRRSGGLTLTAYPSLVDEGDSVGVQVFETAAEQAASMRAGTRRLLLITVPTPLRAVVGALDYKEKLALGRYRHGTVPQLLDDTVEAAIDALVAQNGGPAFDPDGFRALRDAVRRDLTPLVVEAAHTLAGVLSVAGGIEERIAALEPAPVALRPTIADVRAHLDSLVGPRLVSGLGLARLADLHRYLRALERRLDTLRIDPVRDRLHQAIIERVRADFADKVAHLPAARRDSDDVRAIRWMIEELRVSLFAQALGTATPISEKRIQRAIDALA